MTNRYDILFATNRFNLSEPKAHFTNPCCYGDDTAAWIRSKLTSIGVKTTEPAQEDWGWHLDVTHNQASYFLGIGGNPDSETSGNQGQWRLMVQKHRSFTDKLLGKNKLSKDEQIITTLSQIVGKEPDMKLLGTEEG